MTEANNFDHFLRTLENKLLAVIPTTGQTMSMAGAHLRLGGGLQAGIFGQVYARLYNLNVQRATFEDEVARGKRLRDANIVIDEISRAPIWKSVFR